MRSRFGTEAEFMPEDFVPPIDSEGEAINMPLHDPQSL